MLQKLKTFLSIPENNTTNDEYLQLMLDNIFQSYSLFKKETRKEKFFRKKFKNNLIPISFPFVQEVKKINNITLTEKDYEILDSWEVFIKDSSKIPHEDVVIVEFVSGFDEIPQKYLKDIFSLVQNEFSKENGKEVASEKLGPRSVSYESGGTDENAKNNPNSAKNIDLRLKNACIPPHLKFF